MGHLFLRVCVALVTFITGVGVSHLRPVPRATRPAAIAEAPQSLPEDSPCDDELRGYYDDARVEFHYYHYTFGFSVDLPKGIIGAREPSSPSQHGFGIDLDNPTSTEWLRQPVFPKSYVYVDGSYNSALWESLDDAVQSHLGYIADGGTEVALLKKTATRLAGLRAVRFVARYKEGGEVKIYDVILAFRNENDGDVVYTIALDTPLENYERDKAVVAALQKSWRLQPLP